ncbi:MAG: phosphohydrolase [Myxococcota bacterium]|nr:phosphohydrolase [Myxococcota bacterium]
MISIRDPIHGNIRLSPDELAIVDHPIFQRLRGIKQLGFTDQAFPGATHTRYAHGLGAMEVVTRMFDGVFPADRGLLPPETRTRFRQLLRLALLLHDLGHPPGSHASEAAMPNRHLLGLDCFSDDEQAQQACHEDYTIKLLVDSPLTGALMDRFSDYGIYPKDIANLITGRYGERNHAFQVDGIDYLPLLGQMVSGEMDADRMDYLQRDSFYTGVSYGKFDQTWLLDNLTHHIVDNRAYMALTNRAVFAFEDFLLSRYHMFVSVYYHYISVGFETMLARFYQEARDDFHIPADSAAYALTDDIALWAALRKSDNPWAIRIAARDGYRRVLEVDRADEIDVDALQAALNEKGIEHFVSRDKGVLSKYYLGRGVAHPIYVVHKQLKRVRPMSSEARIYERYRQPVQLIRVYVRPDQQTSARRLLDSFLG